MIAIFALAHGKMASPTSGKVYTVYCDTKRTFADSVAFCKAEGKSIASFHSTADADQVKGKVGCTAYIGAERVEGKWTFTDGSRFWKYAENDGLNNKHGGKIEDKIAWHKKDGKWHDWEDGNAQLGVICQQEPAFKTYTVYCGAKKNFAESHAFCKSKGGSMATFHSNADVAKVVEQVACTAYIGAMKSGDGKWHFTDGSPFWKYAENDGLNNKNEDKIAWHNKDKKWHDWEDGNAKLGVICQQATVYMEPKGLGRCSAGGTFIKTAARCKAAIEQLMPGLPMKGAKTVSAWGNVCGCAYNAETGTMQFNKFMHPDYCNKSKRWTKHNPRHMMAQNTDSWRGMQAICKKTVPVLKNAGANCWFNCGLKSGKCAWCGDGKCCRAGWKGGEAGCAANEGGNHFHACIVTMPKLDAPKPAKYFLGKVGVGRCPEPNHTIQPEGVPQIQDKNYGSLWSAAECRGALKLMGKEVKSETDVSEWGKVCGCAYNEETGKMQYNKFIHPAYCWTRKHGAHMDVQDRDARNNKFRAVCRPSALTPQSM